MSPFKDELNLFEISVSATVGLQQYLRNFFCHDITDFNAAKSEMFRVNTFVNIFVLFHGGENKQEAEEIHSFLSEKQTRNSLKTAHDNFWTELGMISNDTLSQKRSLY